MDLHRIFARGNIHFLPRGNFPRALKLAEYVSHTRPDHRTSVFSSRVPRRGAAGDGTTERNCTRGDESREYGRRYRVRFCAFSATQTALFALRHVHICTQSPVQRKKLLPSRREDNDLYSGVQRSSHNDRFYARPLTPCTRSR